MDSHRGILCREVIGPDMPLMGCEGWRAASGILMGMSREQGRTRQAISGPGHKLLGLQGGQGTGGHVTSPHTL